MKKGRLVIIQGAQWGSEGKGLVAAHQARIKGASAAVRTGSINAGHTVFYEGKEYKMQTIPTAWVIPDVKLYIGPGAYIEPEVLAREILWLQEAGIDVASRLFIDYRCFLHTSSATEKAKAANRHHAMGATGKGSSEALIEKLNSRGLGNSEHLKFCNHPMADLVNLADVPQTLSKEYYKGETILLEGTQGAALDLHLGPHPFVSNRGANAATWVAEAGLPPSWDTEVVLVARTMPIRVAGNSGPMSGEVGWVQTLWDWYNNSTEGRFPFNGDHINEFDTALREISNSYGCPPLSMPGMWSVKDRDLHRIALSEGPTKAWDLLTVKTREILSPYIERTTVTRKFRRIASFNLTDFKKAIVNNGPTEAVFTFMNYTHPNDWNADELSFSALSWLKGITAQTGVPITWASTGPGMDKLISID